jgi:hypothetical protein
MTPTSIDFDRERMMALVTLAEALERFDRGASSFTADQYRAVVKRLKAALRSNVEPAALQAVLATHPATAEVYENLHYERAGLARSPLDLSVSAELQVTQALERLRR